MPVAIPAHLIEAINRLVRLSRRMFTETGREPTAEELAERLVMPLDKVRELLSVARRPVAP